MRLFSLLRGVVFIGVLFFLLPRAFVALNAWLGWPRWEAAAADVAGALLVAAGAGVGLHCSGLFRLGGGTPVPSEPPTRLVVEGLYRVSRHPIYVAYVTIAVGIFLLQGHAALLLYPVVVFLLAQAYVVGWEEPELAERFGEAWEAYRRRVPRWPGARRAAESRTAGS